MGVLHILSSDNFVVYSKVIARKYGVNSAILLGALCSYQNSFGDNEFYKEQEKIIEDTCLSRYEIQQSIKVLAEADIITVVKKGIPAKNYYYVSDVKLSNILMSCDTTSKTQNNNTDTNNTTKENIYLKESSKIKRFVPPTVEEVSAFCKEKGYSVDAEMFVSWYDSNGWRVGKNKMVSWKSAVATWERKNKASKTTIQQRKIVRDYDERKYEDDDFKSLVSDVNNLSLDDI